MLRILYRYSLFPYTTLFRSLAGLEKMQFFFEQQGIGAEVDILFPRHEPFHNPGDLRVHQGLAARDGYHWRAALDRKSIRLNSSHTVISYAVFCLKKKTTALA